jgi:glycosyltransferase involved in cell wall biosynthesis
MRQLRREAASRSKILAMVVDAPAAPRISLVIPAYNEAGYLPRLLDTVAAARTRYVHGADAVEVIVADNMSTDDTAAIARARGCQVATVEQRRIGAARNGGAAIARGEILAFTDADMLIHPETFNAIDTAISRPRVVGGATGVTLDRWSLGLTATYVAMLPLVYVTGMDTGVVFCRRADFVTIGGYDARRYIAEDVVFLLALKRLGRSRGQRLTRLRPVKAIASTRKFDRYGDWHYFTSMLKATVMWWRPYEANEFVRKYWYEDR